MRLPRSSSQYFSIRILFSALLFVFVALLPLTSRAATQQLVASPSKVRFGSVVLGQSEAQEIVLTNTGTTSTSVSAISLGGTAFKISGLKLPVTLAAGQSVGLTTLSAGAGACRRPDRLHKTRQRPRIGPYGGSYGPDERWLGADRKQRRLRR